jgi:hypothetical protein
MRRALAVMLAPGAFAAGCTGRGLSPSTHPPTQATASPVASTMVRLAKPKDITVTTIGSQIVVKPENDPAAMLWTHGLMETVGTAYASRKPPGFHYAFGDTTDSGVTATVTCEADSTEHLVRVVFVR